MEAQDTPSDLREAYPHVFLVGNVESKIPFFVDSIHIAYLQFVLFYFSHAARYQTGENEENALVGEIVKK